MNGLIPFAKIEATGNDFVLFYERDLQPERLTAEFIAHLCDRHFGIGADGLILLTGSAGELHMHYYNADGSAGAMCGNGLRAAVLYARVLGLCSSEKGFRLGASDGLHAYSFNSDGTITVEVFVESAKTPPVELHKLSLPEGYKLLGFLNTGVPHLVLEAEEAFDSPEFPALARELRFSKVFGKPGTNVNVVRKIGNEGFKIRTYERGVEGETLSCGTGISASAWLLWKNYRTMNSVLTVEAAGGQLKVAKKNSQKTILLTGPAHLIFVGQIDLSDWQTKLSGLK